MQKYIELINIHVSPRFLLIYDLLDILDLLIPGIHITCDCHRIYSS